MLTKMYLTNFLSFSDRTEFDFTATKYSILSQTNVYNEDVLKGALIIGANASGKSNALKGITFLINLIKGEGVAIGSYRCTFGETVFTTAEYEFVFDGKRVSYKIEYDIVKRNLIEELLIDSSVVLKRNGEYGEIRIGDLLIKEDNLEGDTLFLRTASFNTGRFPQQPILRKLMEYLLNSYYIDGYNQGALWGKSVMQYAEEHGVEKLNQYLNDFNYDFYVEYGSESEGEGLKVTIGGDKKGIFFKRKSFPIPNVFIIESQGNQVFADMLPRLISVIEKPGMFVFDEFGNSLHNKLSEKIIRFFMQKSLKSQMFITSHHTNLVSNSVFRPDQINLISFQASNGSKVNRLSEFKPREAQNLEKMYLGGMFEGLPLYENENI